MFDDSRLEDPGALGALDGRLRHLAENGRRVREQIDAAETALSGVGVEGLPRAIVTAGADSRLLRAVAEPWSPVPIVAWPGPGLPGWTGAIDLVLVMSPGPNDPAALSAVHEAVRRGSSLVLAADPRSQIAEMAAGPHRLLLPAHQDDALATAVVMLMALRRLGIGPDLDGEQVAQALDGVAVECSPHRDIASNPAKALALALADALPLIWGGSVLAARAARRVAEAIRRSTGRPGLAADAAHLVPVIEGATPRDLFADPFEGPAASERPALVVLDDGNDSPLVREERGWLSATAASRDVRVETITCTDGSPVARYAALLAHGTYAATYLELGLSEGPAGA